MKQEKPKLVRAEVIDVVSLNTGADVYRTFGKGIIVEVDPITFRNLERQGKLKTAAETPTVPRRKAKKPTLPVGDAGFQVGGNS